LCLQVVTRFRPEMAVVCFWPDGTFRTPRSGVDQST
jgi:hypothetical protein